MRFAQTDFRTNSFESFAFFPCEPFVLIDELELLFEIAGIAEELDVSGVHFRRPTVEIVLTTLEFGEPRIVRGDGVDGFRSFALQLGPIVPQLVFPATQIGFPCGNHSVPFLPSVFVQRSFRIERFAVPR